MSIEPRADFMEEIPDLPDKILAVIKLKMAGATDDEIASVLSLPDGPNSVEKLIERALRKEMMRNTSTREYARALVKKKLDGLYGSVASKAFNPNHPEHLAAVGKARELLAQEAKLLGLDAATELTVHTPDTAELAKFVERYSSLASLPEEGNVLDGEVIEDE